MKFNKELYNKALNFLKYESNEKNNLNNRFEFEIEWDESGEPVKLLIITKSNFNLINISIVDNSELFNNNTIVYEHTSIHKIWNYRHYNELKKYFN